MVDGKKIQMKELMIREASEVVIAEKVSRFEVRSCEYRSKVPNMEVV